MYSHPRTAYVSTAAYGSHGSPEQLLIQSLNTHGLTPTHPHPPCSPTQRVKGQILKSTLFKDARICDY